MRVPYLIGGAIALGLGVYGIYDEYFTVVEFLKGVMQPLFVLVGFIAILAGLLSRKTRFGHVAFGIVLLGLGVYGFFDEYYAALDFFKGSVPLAMLVIGMTAVVAGVRKVSSQEDA